MKFRKILLYIILIGCVSVLAVFGIYFVICYKYQPKSIEEIDTTADCILVLGARVYDNGALSPMLSDRVKTAVTLYQNGAAKCLLMSGDHQKDDYDEPGAMRKFAGQNGIPAQCILEDGEGLDTYRSILRAKQAYGYNKIIIVTQDFHLPRALYIADRLGVEAVGVSADLQKYHAVWKNYLREVPACFKAFLQCGFSKKPNG